jgi:hypothetical protein
MSTFSPGIIRCPCGHDFEVDVADGLHVSLRPDLRDAILAGSFHRFACPRCARVSVIEKLLAYTDFPRRQWLTVVPAAGLARRSEWLRLAEDSFRATMIERAAPMVTAWAPEMTRRVGFGLVSLREKLAAFDAGLDDRILELVKLQMIRAGEVPYTAGAYFHFIELRDWSLVFEWAWPGDAGTSEITAPRALHDDLAARGEEAHALAFDLFTSSIADHRTYSIADETAWSPGPP